MKNRIVLLNTSIITKEGTFTYKKISLMDAQQNIDAYKEQGLEVLSAIGHESTAQILSKLLGIEVKVNRMFYEQSPTDNVIVFKLNGRPEEGKILSTEDIEKIGYSFGLLTMV